jgi:hypothetical protein
MTVKNFFNYDGISLGMLEERSKNSEYWDSAYNFVNGKWNDLTSVVYFTDKQYQWLEKIHSDMVKWQKEAPQHRLFENYHNERK